MTAKAIESVLNNVLPKGTYINVVENKGVFGGDQIKIMFAAGDYLINNVSGQRTCVVSLLLTLDDNELRPQIFGGNGGRRIYFKTDPNNPKHKFLALSGVDLPFRKPQPNEKAIMNAIKKFAENWLKAIRENKEFLTHTDKVDYSIFLT
jgi:hypothetical protein